MKKKIIIDSVDEVKVKKIERNIKNKPYHRLINNKYLEWLIYMIGYSIVLITVSAMFKSFEINMDYFGIYALLASIIIYILNQTIKPIINYLTIPLTILTLGLMYPISNVIILYLTSYILGRENFFIGGFIAPFFIAIVISFLNVLMEGLVIKPIIKRKNS